MARASRPGQAGDMPRAVPQRAESLGQPVIAFFRFQQIAGKTEIEPAGGRNASPGRIGMQQRLDVWSDHSFRRKKTVHKRRDRPRVDDFLFPDGESHFAVARPERPRLRPASERSMGSSGERRRRLGLACGVSSNESWRMEPRPAVSVASSAATYPSRISAASSRSRELSSNSRSSVAASCLFTGRTFMASRVSPGQRDVSSVVSWRYRNMASSCPSNFLCRAGGRSSKPSRMASRDG